ncbi:TetR/AcrR family transcriptional regulator [Levilactobacillus bambusae]|uniref:HTH tetR-type domain-containing protein n=1 Tax=Levilactobacillus bambusae TaxID=2024736 RepID=A0A2V1N121_9LACO|nr:TetR/AcrR family transcriptional regulator [Levilactobacillus bambusae]PWG00937.1 hypothetical protein DCM90_01815 [Levilactobacillus bambusae]
MNALDARVTKTREKLTAALIDLMNEAPLEKISVQKLTTRAHVTRGTFYLHYQDKNDFIQQLMSRTLDEWLESARVRANLVATDPVKWQMTASGEIERFSLIRALQFVAERRDLFLLLIRNEHFFQFRKQLSERLTLGVKQFYQQLQSEIGELTVPIDLQAAFLTSAFRGITSHWLEVNTMYAPHFVDEAFQSLTHRELTQLIVADWFSAD